MLDQNAVALMSSVEADRFTATAKAPAHPARDRIITIPLATPRCIGGNVVEEDGLAQSTVSEHLSIPQDAGILVGAVEDPPVCCSLDPAALAPIRAPKEAIAASTRTAEACNCHILPDCAPRESAP